MQVDSHGGRELGSNVVVITDHVAVYVYDLAALATYANGWIDPAVTANHQLPEQAEPFGTGPEFTPGVIIRAHGRDEIDHTYDVTRKVMIVKIGQVRWLVYDRARLPQHEHRLGPGQGRRQDHAGQPPLTRVPTAPPHRAGPLPRRPAPTAMPTSHARNPRAGCRRPRRPHPQRPARPVTGTGAAAATRGHPTLVVHKSRIRPHSGRGRYRNAGSAVQHRHHPRCQPPGGPR